MAALNTDYYSRTATLNTDGSPLFAIGYDKENEGETCGLLSRVWKCEIRPFGRLSPVDFYAVRDGRMVGVLELKSRTHANNKYPTVFLNVRKWTALMMAGMGLAVPALFVVRFTDGVFYANVGEIDARRWKIGGTKEIVKSQSDIEPVIEVPVATMKKIIDMEVRF
jgi:hypothetical protein